MSSCTLLLYSVVIGTATLGGSGGGGGGGGMVKGTCARPGA